jgi:hypothetical protein
MGGTGKGSIPMKNMKFCLIIIALTIVGIAQINRLEGASSKSRPQNNREVIRMLPLLYYGQFFGLDELFPGMKKAQPPISINDMNLNDNSFSFIGSIATINGLSFKVNKETVVPAKGGFFVLTPSDEGISFIFEKQ